MMSTVTTPPLAHEPQSNSHKRISWILGMLSGAIVTVILVGAAVWLSTGLGLLHLLWRGHTEFNVDQPTVVRQIQQLRRLETVMYTMDKIISGEHANAYLPKFLAGDR